MIIIILITTNVLQIYHVKENHNKIDDISTEKTEISNRYNELRSETQNLITARDILFYTRFVSYQDYSFNGNRIVSILPANTCGSCLLADSNVLLKIQKSHPDKIFIYFLGDENSDNIKYINPEFKSIKDINKILQTLSGNDLQINYPIHILVGSNNSIINVYVTDFYNPSNSKIFLERLSLMI